jgi:hypothetical protein
MNMGTATLLFYAAFLVACFLVRGPRHGGADHPGQAAA